MVSVPRLSMAKVPKINIPRKFRNDIVWAEVLWAQRPIFWIIGSEHAGKTSLAQYLAETTHYRLINIEHLQNDQPSTTNLRNQSNTKFELMKREIKRTFKFCRGYIMDDFPLSMSECRKFERKMCKPSVLIYIQIGLDAALGRALAVNPTVDLNETRMAYVKETSFAEKAARKYQKQNKVIKIFSQYPIQEVHAKVLELLETDFNFKFKQFSRQVA